LSLRSKALNQIPVSYIAISLRMSRGRGFNKISKVL
jgi:hypothetical protein